MKELSLEQVGQRLKKERLCRELTREQFAEQVGISPQFLAELENGKKGMSAETLYKICTRHGLSADYLLLGKLDVGALSDPVGEALQKIPEPYLRMTEKIIRAIEKVAAAK